MLAIDPSASAVGWAVLDGPVRVDSGAWRPSQAQSARPRFGQMARFVRELILAYEPDVCVVELPHKGRRSFGGRPAGGSSERTYAMAVGVVLGQCYAGGTRVVEVDVNQWKGFARKRDTAVTVKYALRYAPQSEDESDALGIALWYGGGGWLEAKQRELRGGPSPSLFRRR